jgi:hypothetical protein
VAALFSYPVRVNTESWCPVDIPDAEAFVRSYREIVTPRLRNAVLKTRKPWRKDGWAVGAGYVWLTPKQDGTANEFTLNPGAWEVSGLACKHTVFEPIPDFVWGAWTITSLRATFETRDRSPEAYRSHGTLVLDAGTRSATFGLERHKHTKCAISAYGYLTADALVPRAPEDYGLKESFDPPRFLRVFCTAKDGRHAEDIDVMGPTRLVTEIWDATYAVLARVPDPGTPKRIVKKGDECGEPTTVCGGGLVCISDRRRASGLLKIEKPLRLLGGRDRLTMLLEAGKMRAMGRLRAPVDRRVDRRVRCTPWAPGRARCYCLRREVHAHLRRPLKS